MLSVNISDIIIITVKKVDYGCIIHNISKTKDLEDHGYVYIYIHIYIRMYICIHISLHQTQQFELKQISKIEKTAMKQNQIKQTCSKDPVEKIVVLLV